jgi:N utilization substance protein A
MSLFQRMTGATARDCIIDEKGNRIIFLVSKGQMGLAIGKSGSAVKSIERVVKRHVEVVEWSEDMVELVRNALNPKYVIDVRVTERLDGTKGIVVVVDPKKKGAVLGEGGKNAERLRLIVRRHFDIPSVQIVASY